MSITPQHTNRRDTSCNCWACRPELMAAEYRRLNKDIPLAEADGIIAAFDRLREENKQLTAAAEAVLAHTAALIGEPMMTGGPIAERLSFESGRLAGEFTNHRTALARLTTLCEILSQVDPDGEEYTAAEKALRNTWPDHFRDRLFCERVVRAAIETAWAINHPRRTAAIDKFNELRLRAAAAERDRDMAAHRLAKVDEELRRFGIEYPLGAAGVRDVAAMANGRLEDLQTAEARLAILETVAVAAKGWAAEWPQGNITGAPASILLSSLAQLDEAKHPFEDAVLNPSDRAKLYQGTGHTGKQGETT